MASKKRSKWYGMVKRNYLAERWDETMLENVYKAGRISKAEYEEILSLREVG